MGSAIQPGSGFCAQAAIAMKGQVTAALTCTSTCAAGGSCASGGRRLSETEAHARQLSTPQVAVTYVLTFPPGTSTAAATSAITSVNANTFKTAFTQALTTAGGNTSAFATQVQSATPLSTPLVLLVISTTTLSMNTTRSTGHPTLLLLARVIVHLRALQMQVARHLNT